MVIIPGGGLVGALLGVVLLVLITGTPLLALWLGLFRPLRLVRRHLGILSPQLGLAPATASESDWLDLREQPVGFAGPYPIARGARDHHRVELTCQTGSNRMTPSTTVVVVGAERLAGRVLIDRRPDAVVAMAFGQAFGRRLFSRLNRGAEARVAWQAWVGWSVIYDEAGDAPRLFTPEVQNALGKLPRKLALFGFQERAAIIGWHGVECDVDVIEQAFAIGAECLRLVGAR